MSIITNIMYMYARYIWKPVIMFPLLVMFFVLISGFWSSLAFLGLAAGEHRVLLTVEHGELHLALKHIDQTATHTVVVHDYKRGSILDLYSIATLSHDHNQEHKFHIQIQEEQSAFRFITARGIENPFAALLTNATAHYYTMASAAITFLPLTGTIPRKAVFPSTVLLI